MPWSSCSRRWFFRTCWRYCTPRGKWYSDINAPDVQVGWVLLQKKPEKTKTPSAYWFNLLTSADLVYHTLQREFFAIFWVILLLRSYFQGTHFTTCTGHDSFKWMLDLSDVSGRLASWCSQVSDFDFDVVHQTGEKRQVAGELLKALTDGQASDLDKDVPLRNVDNTRKLTREYLTCTFARDATVKTIH